MAWRVFCGASPKGLMFRVGGAPAFSPRCCDLPSLIWGALESPWGWGRYGGHSHSGSKACKGTGMGGSLQNPTPQARQLLELFPPHLRGDFSRKQEAAGKVGRVRLQVLPPPPGAAHPP